MPPARGSDVTGAGKARHQGRVYSGRERNPGKLKRKQDTPKRTEGSHWSHHDLERFFFFFFFWKRFSCLRFLRFNSVTMLYTYMMNFSRSHHVIFSHPFSAEPVLPISPPVRLRLVFVWVEGRLTEFNKGGLHERVGGYKVPDFILAFYILVEPHSTSSSSTAPNPWAQIIPAALSC